jgi:hypothetical protein
MSEKIEKPGNRNLPPTLPSTPALIVDLSGRDDGDFLEDSAAFDGACV